MSRPSRARDVARAVLRRVEQGEAYASLALAGELERAGLSPADRGLATELALGVLRHRTRLDRALSAHATRGVGKSPVPVLAALRMAAYQLLFLRTPAHAAVDDAVAAVKQTAGPQVASFANAVLRKLATEGEPPPPPATDVPRVLEEMHSVPRWLGARMIALVGPDEALAWAETTNRPPRVAIRASLWRIGADDLATRLAAERPDARIEQSRYLPESLLLAGAGAPESLASFQEGLFTVQDVAATLIGHLCGVAPGERILDACSGVGGKASHLAALARAAGGPAHIDAADLSARKLDLAQDAARRLGVAGDIRTIEADLTAPGPGTLADAYDRILLDAPCSGLGVLRRHPEGKWRRRPAEIPKLAALQAQLLDSVATRVRPGGVLVYSVCTFTDEEGPAQLARFLETHPEFRLEPPTATAGVDFAPFQTDAGFFRSFPHRHDADGFFAARLRRSGLLDLVLDSRPCRVPR